MIMNRRVEAQLRNNRRITCLMFHSWRSWKVGRQCQPGAGPVSA
jgi:hypothetical protein